MKPTALNDGGQAFPAWESRPTSDGRSGITLPVGGMSLRDYFAAKAMQAIMTAPPDSFRDGDGAPIESWSGFARAAFVVADAMLAARAKQP